jgi:hypothetical protein
VFRSTAAQDPESHIRNIVSREAQRLIGEQEYAGKLSEIGQELDEDIAPALTRIKSTIMEYCPGLESVKVSAEFDLSRASPHSPTSSELMSWIVAFIRSRAASSSPTVPRVRIDIQLSTSLVQRRINECCKGLESGISLPTA